MWKPPQPHNILQHLDAQLQVRWKLEHCNEEVAEFNDTNNKVSTLLLLILLIKKNKKSFYNEK